MAIRNSRPHGEKEFTYHAHRVEDGETFADNYDRIFKKGKYAVEASAPEVKEVFCSYCQRVHLEKTACREI